MDDFNPDPNADLLQTLKNSKIRFRWPTGEIVTREKDETYYAYPFIDEDNDKDALYITLLLEKRPWQWGFGGVKKSWEELCETIRKIKGDDGTLIYDGISVKAIRTRYEFYVNVGKRWNQQKTRGNQPPRDLDSDADDDDEGRSSRSQQMREGVKDICEGWLDSVLQKEAQKINKEDEERVGKEQSELIKDAALGKISGRHVGGNDISTPQGSSPPVSSSSSGRSSRASSTAPVTLDNDFSCLVAMAKDRFKSKANPSANVELLKQKDENKKRKLDIMERKLALDERRMALEEERNKQQSEQNRAQAELMKKLLEKLVH